MTMFKVKLLRPLLNRPVGSEAEYEKADAERLAGYGAVEILGEVKPEKKAAEPTENKAEPAAPANKAKAAKATKGK